MKPSWTYKQERRERMIAAWANSTWGPGKEEEPQRREFMRDRAAEYWNEHGLVLPQSMAELDYWLWESR